MPSIKEKKSFERAAAFELSGGGGEPLGEMAPASEILERMPDEIG